MSSWSKNRKLTYGTIVIVIVAVAICVPAFFWFYKAPTCFDGIQNGNEQGIDCGGSCQKLCPNAFLAPDVSWTDFEQVAPGVANLAAYIVNPNTSGEAADVPYHMVAYDDQGTPLVDVSGTVTLPPQRNTLAFLPSVSTGKQTPYRVFFEFTAAPDWHKRSDPLAALSIGDKNYQDTPSGSSLSVILKNNSVDLLQNITVYVVLKDINANVVGFSKTAIDQISAESSVSAPFTWPVNRHGAVVSIDVLPVAPPITQ